MNWDQIEGQWKQFKGKAKHSQEHQAGKIGYILLWLLGIPIPILFAIYLLRGCT